MFHDPTERARELCRQLKPLIGEQADRIWMAYLAENEDGRQQIIDYLELKASSQFHGSLGSQGPGLVPPEPQEAAGEYVLGDVVYNGKTLCPFGLRESEWIQHAAVFGRSGAGKTNLSFIMVREILKKGKPVLIFDWKRNYRDLLSIPGFEKMAVYTIGRSTSPFSFNPLVPPRETNARTWLKKIVAIMAYSFMLGDGVMFLLSEAIDKVYADAGVYDGTVKTWPTFRDVLHVLRERKTVGREAGWLASALRAVSNLCFGDMDRLLNEGHDDLETLINRPVILELDGLTTTDKTFFIQSVMLWLYHYRMVEADREQFKSAVLLEEAHNVLGSRTSLVGDMSLMEVIQREIRELGTALWLVDQMPSSLPLSVLANTHTNIVFSLKTRADMGAVAQTLLLPEDAKSAPAELQVGEAIVRLQGRLNKAFTIRVPEFHIKKGSYTDAMVTRHMMDLGLLSARRQAKEAPQAPLSAEPEAPDIEQLFLTDIARFPNSGIAERYRRLGLTVRLGQKLKAYFIEKGLIQEHIQTTPQGRLRVIRLTEEGKLQLPEQVSDRPGTQDDGQSSTSFTTTVGVL